MSDNILKLIPDSLTFVPKESSQRTAKVMVDILFPFAEAESVSFKQSNNPQFVDPGANRGSIICPNCTAIVLCCNSKTTLNNLKHEWPIGFAQFRIEIVNPNRYISEEDLYEVEMILDTTLRRIWAHY